MKMAAPKSPFFKSFVISKMLLKNNVGNLNSECRNIIAVHDSTLFCWNPDTQCLLAKNYNEDFSKSFSDEHSKEFLPTSPPVFEVGQISVNDPGTLIVIWGSSGVAVMEFPSHFWQTGGAMYHTKDHLLCRCWNIAERFFMCNSRVCIYHVAWHPCSTNHSHLVILTSDNFLRIFDVSKPQSPLQTISLGETPQSFLTSRATFSFCLGESAVCFDFGQPFVLEKSETDLWCPIFVLKGNGDVLLVYSSLNRKVRDGGVVLGPLTMHPAAEDNYGVDACSLICLDCQPPVIVVATSTGLLHHAIALPLQQPPDLVDQQSFPDLALYVYETAELSLTLTPLQPEAALDSCPINLFKDPTMNCRYHCSHMAGIHTVMLPLVRQLELLLEKESENLESVLQNQESIIEHILCTQPFPESPTSPVLGIAISAGARGAHLLALLPSWEFVAIPLLSTLYTEEEPFSPSMVDVREDKLHTVGRSTFMQHIQKILARPSGSMPLLKSLTPALETSPQRALELLYTITENLRQNYISKLDLARMHLQRRVKILMEQKTRQQQELIFLLHQKDLLRTKAEELAEKYDDVNSQHIKLMQRVEKILQALQRRQPVLSDAELAMQRELEHLEERLPECEALVKDARSKRNYQARLALTSDSSSLASPTSSITPAYLASIRSALTQETHTINELVKKVHIIKKEVCL